MRAKIIRLMITGVLLTGVVNAGIMYPDPVGGWKYIFQGDAAATPNATALDGTWNHDNGSDMWDLLGIGAGMPGGVSVITEDNVNFLRIQDPGDPRDYGLADPSNRKIYFTHDLTQELDAATAGGILTNGITISFRARLSTSGLLDQRYPNAGTAPEPWPTGGDGGFIHDAGKGFFGIRQNTNDWIISFSLALKSDHANVPADGLIMNRQLASGTGRGDVDTSDNPANSTVPYVALDPTQWHEFWITIAQDTTVPGATHRVTVWMDGSLDVAGSFLVTAGDGNEGSSNHIALGHGPTDPSAAFDTDFFAYTTGVVEPKPDPTFNPPPTADAGPDNDKTLVGLALPLNGTVSDQPPQVGDPGVLSWYWKKETGPGTVIFAPSPTAEDPTATFSAKGMYTLLLQATDGTKDANDVINVWVADRAEQKLVGYWDMENTLEDKSVNNNNGTLYFNKKVSTENRFVADSAIGSASIDLNTTDPAAYFVYLGPAPELDFSTGGPGDFTVTAWVKTLSGRDVFSKGGDDTNGIRYVLAVGESGGGKADMVTDDNVTKVTVSSSGAVNDGKWHFIAAQRDWDVTKVYVDGILAGTSDLPGISYNLSGTSQKGAYIGIGIDQVSTEPNSVNTKRFLGQIDDVRVYNYALALEDAGFDSIRSLAAMGSIPATVNAGPDGSFLMKPGLSYQLAGVVTDYGKPDIQTILWTTVSGPDGAEATFANAGSPTSTVAFPKGGVYTLKLTVIDAVGTFEDTVVITTTTPSCADVVSGGLIQKTDLNKDCYVNLQDLAMMVQNWTKCNNPEDINCIWPF